MHSIHPRPVQYGIVSARSSAPSPRTGWSAMDLQSERWAKEDTHIVGPTRDGVARASPENQHQKTHAHAQKKATRQTAVTQSTQGTTDTGHAAHGAPHKRETRGDARRR